MQINEVQLHHVQHVSHCYELNSIENNLQG